MSDYTHVFVDFEWADPLGWDVVSMALVTDDGRELYLERDPLPTAPTEWVGNVVYPLLDRTPGVAVQDAEFTRRTQAFLSGLASPFVFADTSHDLVVLRHVLAGFKRLDAGAAANPAPTFIQWVLTDCAPGFESYFRLNPEAKARRHHALVDARALRYAWMSAREGAGRR